MKVLEIEGNKPLSGTINIGGAKNSAVALIPACILGNNLTTLTNVPDITDINIHIVIMIIFYTRIIPINVKNYHIMISKDILLMNLR